MRLNGITERGFQRLVQKLAVSIDDFNTQCQKRMEDARKELENYESLESAPLELADRAAFGVNDGDITDMPLQIISIVHERNWENAKLEAEDKGAEEYANQMNFGKPIQVRLVGGKFQLEDGHHRMYAAELLGKESLQTEILIDDDPIIVLEREGVLQ